MRRKRNLEMIGQKNLFKELDEYKTVFPRFVIIAGNKGSGKNLMADYIARKLIGGEIIVASDVKISTLKELIEASYKLTNQTVYIIPHADDMSLQAKNSMLKVFEEPSNKAYWIITLENIDNTLPTIRSRAIVINMEPYTKKEILDFASTIIKEDELSWNIIASVCDTPGEVVNLVNSDIIPFYQYVELVVDNIAEVSGANSFKIANKLALKKDSEGYDLELFWKTFKSICMKHINELTSSNDVNKYAKGIIITTKYMSELGISGINKQSLVDAWILDIRKAWM